jgi:hypothetical protein
MLAVMLAACNLSKAPEPTADVKALYTAAAGTLISQFNDQQTQTAMSVSPTPMASFTPLPTFALGAGLTPFGTSFALGSGLTPFGTSFAIGSPNALGTPAAGLTPLATAQPAGTGSYSFPVGCDDATLIKETIPDGKSVNGGTEFDKSWTFQNTGTCTWDMGYSLSFLAGDRMKGVDLKITQEADFTKPGKSHNFVVTMSPPVRPGEYKGYWQMKNDTGTSFGSKVWVDVVVH